MPSPGKNDVASDTHLRFRPDIAGLRAIAVVPILLVHAGMGFVPGGFVGVDIFFVISGFLITAILLRDERSFGTMLLHFYRRRAVRILPALLLVLATTLIAGCLVMLPDELHDLGLSSAAAAGFSSNLYFWRTANYFDDAVAYKPLLHTWSLGVEEQFYLLYPLLVYWMKQRVHFRTILLGLALASLVVAIGVTALKPVTAFYVLPTRAWELALGGLIAAGGFPRVSRRGTANALAAAGLVMILISLVFIDDTMAFPAPWALLPCIGTALVIAYGEATLAGKAIATPALRGIGAISYSLYLWHWPVMSFWRFRYGAELDIVEQAIVIAVSLALASGTYVFVERRSLRRYNKGAATPVLLAAGGGIVLAVAISLVVASQGASWRTLDATDRALLSYSGYSSGATYRAQFRPGECFSTSSDRRFDFEHCLAPSPYKRNVVLLGDSHAAHLWLALARAHPEVNLMQASASGCKPTLDTRGDRTCVHIMQEVLGPILQRGEISRVVLAARWTAQDVPALLLTIAALRERGVAVTVIGPVVEYRLPLPRLIVRSRMQRDPNLIAEGQLQAPALLDRRLDGEVTRAGASYVSLHRAECPSSGSCAIFTRGVPVHFDYGHLSYPGAQLLVSRLKMDL